jgi:hypothetical protein
MWDQLWPSRSKVGIAPLMVRVVVVGGESAKDVHWIEVKITKKSFCFTKRLKGASKNTSLP